jgi:hypothetical protein
MRTETRGHRSGNAFKVTFLFNFMDLAIACCNSATLHGEDIPERAVASARRSYGSAIRFAGYLSFDARQVAEFEGRSIRLEALIRELQGRKACDAQARFIR